MLKSSGLRGVSRSGCALVALGWCVAGAAWSQGAIPQAQELVAAGARAEAPLQVQVNASTLPRLEAQEGGFQASRVDVSMLPAGGSGLGFAVGMSGFNSIPASAGASTVLPSGFTAVRPSVDLGVTWRQALNGQKQLDVTAWRRVPNDDAYTLVQMRQPVYGARVEMTLTPVRKAGLNIERGFIGMQLESGAKIAIKRKDGKPMVYYRTAF